MSISTLSDLASSWDDIQVAGEFKPLLAGEYGAIVESAELLDTKKPGGKRLSVRFSILGPEGTGRKLFSNFNLVNANPDAVKISMGQFKQFVEALGMNKDDILGKDFNDLVGHKCGVKLIIKEGYNGGLQNEIKSYDYFSEDLAA